MPGFDGTGPAGKGPQTGRGDGVRLGKKRQKLPRQRRGRRGRVGKENK